MKFYLDILGVDGSSTGCVTTSLKIVADVASKLDHEGSSLSLKVESSNDEEVYQILTDLGGFDE